MPGHAYDIDRDVCGCDGNFRKAISGSGWGPLPWQNRYVESLNRRLRDELLNQELFFTLLEAQMLAEDWRTDHNKKPPSFGAWHAEPG